METPPSWQTPFLPFGRSFEDFSVIPLTLSPPLLPPQFLPSLFSRQMLPILPVSLSLLSISDSVPTFFIKVLQEGVETLLSAFLLVASLRFIFSSARLMEAQRWQGVGETLLSLCCGASDVTSLVSSRSCYSFSGEQSPRGNSCS